jgi:hypothetical protein
LSKRREFRLRGKFLPRGSASKHSIKWTSTSEACRKEMLGLFNKTLKERTPQSWDFYKEA